MARDTPPRKSGTAPSGPRSSNPFQLGEQGWRQLVEQVKDYAIFMIDPHGINISWNEGVARVLGYDEPEFLGQDAAEIFTPEDRRAGVPQEELATAARDGQASDDRWMLRKGRVRFWASGMTTAIYGEGGELVGFTKVLRDRTQERLHEEAHRADEERLRESEHRLRTALTAARMGTWEWDILTNEERFDEALDRLFEVAPGERIATLDDLLARIHPESRDAVAAAFRHSAETGADVDLEFRVPLAGGEYRWLRCHGQLLYDAHGDPVRISGACVDVTARRQAEDRLREAQRLDAVGRLAGGVAHEVNNMMTAILGFTDLVLDSMPAGDGRRPDLLQIRRAAARSAAITAQLLAFSRRQLLQPRILDLNQVIDEARPMIDRLLGEDKLFEVRLEPTLWPVHADRGQLEQVLINLALNARDAMPQGGRLTLETRNVTLADDQGEPHEVDLKAGDYVELVVTDTGSGIPAEVQPRIFEPFFTTKPVGQGTGLGLSTVYGIMKQSGGLVSVHSEPGQGTAFKLYLPRNIPAAPASKAAPHEVPQDRETVLVVEDEELVRSMTARLLASQGYTVLAARDAKEALAILRARDRPIRLVLTDVVMPGLVAKEFARQLGALQPGIPVLFMSGFTEEEVARRGLLSPGSAYLQKPFDAAALARRVRAVLDASP